MSLGQPLALVSGVVKLMGLQLVTKEWVLVVVRSAAVVPLAVVGAAVQRLEWEVLGSEQLPPLVA